MSTLKNSNFSFIFESHGTSFLFEDLVALHYLFGESVSYSTHNRKRVFLSNSLMKRINQQGLGRTEQQTQKVIALLRQSIKEAGQLTGVYSKKKQFSKEDLRHAFRVLRSVLHHYAYFDAFYWEQAYTNSAKNATAGNNVRAVGLFKNVIREDVNPIFFSDRGLLVVLVKGLSKQYGLAGNELKCYREQELLLLVNGKRVDRKTIADRRRAYVFYKPSATATRLLVGSAAEKFIAKFEPKRKTNSSQLIYGKSAHMTSRIVRGRVRLITRNYSSMAKTIKQMKQMRLGDILVSESTDPDLMPAFRKAGAVITDVGGMLSHAAITARELNLACIVDTKFASKVLKDGNLVEVDSGKGLVRILNKKTF